MQVLTELRIENVNSRALKCDTYCDVWKQLIQLDKTRKTRIVITARERSKHTTWNNLCGACCINCDGELSRRGTRPQISASDRTRNNRAK